MASFSKTWWGQRFIEALETFTDPGRLARGRSYASEHRIKGWRMEQGRIAAKVRGNINPYFEVYKEPLYTTTLAMTPIAAADWREAIRYLGSKASFVAKLLMNEMPDNIEEAFGRLGLHLLPHDEKDFKTQCSCPDYMNPCKHVAGVYYRLASLLDHDPLLLFELRGLSRENLKVELIKTPLGQVLAAALKAEEPAVQPLDSYYTRPQPLTAPDALPLKAFWQGERPLPSEIEPVVEPAVPAVLVKKGGDFPPFWNKDSSFIGIMEEFYQRVRKQNK